MIEGLSQVFSLDRTHHTCLILLLPIIYPVVLETVLTAHMLLLKLSTIVVFNLVLRGNVHAAISGRLALV